MEFKLKPAALGAAMETNLREVPGSFTDPLEQRSVLEHSGLSLLDRRLIAALAESPALCDGLQDLCRREHLLSRAALVLGRECCNAGRSNGALPRRRELDERRQALERRFAVFEREWQTLLNGLTRRNGDFAPLRVLIEDHLIGRRIILRGESETPLAGVIPLLEHKTCRAVSDRPDLLNALDEHG